MNKSINSILLATIFISINSASFEDNFSERKSSGKRSLEDQVTLQDIMDAGASYEACNLCEMLPKYLKITGYDILLDKLKDAYCLQKGFNSFDNIMTEILSGEKSHNFIRYLMVKIDLDGYVSDIKRFISLTPKLWFYVASNGHLFLVKYIIADRINNYPDVIKKMMKAACIASNLEVISYILQYVKAFNINFDINEEFEGVNYLESACNVCSYDVIKLLIENGAVKDKILFYLFKNSIRSYDQAINIINIIKYLKESAYILNVNLKDEYGDIILHKMYGDFFGKYLLVVLKFLIDEIGGFDINIQNNIGWSVLHHHCESGNIEVIKYLISKGANVDLVDIHGRSPIYHSCVYAMEVFGAIPTEQHLMIVKYFIDMNCKILKDDLGNYCFEFLYNKQIILLLEALDSKLKDINPKYFGRRMDLIDVIIFYLKQDINIESSEFSKLLNRIKKTGEMTTLGKFKKIKEFLKQSILAANSDEIKRIFWDYDTNIFFSNSQMADLIIEKMRSKNYDDLATQALIGEVGIYYIMDKIKHNNTHILWYALKSPKWRNVSKLIIKLSPDIIKNVPDNMYEICAQELIAICADESGIKYSWNGANIN